MWETEHSYFGTLHIVSIIFMLGCLAIGIILGNKFKKQKYDRKKDVALTVLGFVFVGLEAFKIIFRVTKGLGANVSLVSFQICSIPLWILPWIAFMKEGMLKKAFVGFVSFESFTAAFFYFAKPSAIVLDHYGYVCLSMHSMIWHGLMVGCGAFSMIAYRLLDKEGFKSLIYGYILWVIAALIAVVANLIVGAPLNLFWIAPDTKFSYPILGAIFKSPSPYPLFIIAFLIYYALGGLIVYGLGLGATKLARERD